MGIAFREIIYLIENLADISVTAHNKYIPQIKVFVYNVELDNAFLL